MRIKWRDANKTDGRWVEDDVVDEGSTIHVPLLLQDASTTKAHAASPMTGLRPGYATLSEQQLADRNAARQEWLDRQREAWRGSGATFVSPDARRKRPPDDDDEDDEPDFGASVEKDSDVRARSIAARDSYVASLREAYRRGHRPPRPGSPASLPGRMRGLL
jgi:hypothetical protein